MRDSPVVGIDTVSERAIVASLASFPVLLVFDVIWPAAVALSYAAPRHIAPWKYLCPVTPVYPCRA